jgi:hypothetical protein
MVEQTQAGAPGMGSGNPVGGLGFRLGQRSPARAADISSEPMITAPWLLAIMMIALLIPGNLTVAGAQLSPNRALLLGIFPYLAWRWLKGEAGKPNAVDVLMLLCTIWAGLALFVNHGFASVPRAVMLCVELFGGYLFGRMMIRSTADYRRWFVLLAWGFAFLLPFAVVELLTGKNLLRMLFDPIFEIPPRQSNLQPRLGMIRAQGTFEHPILFGLVGSMAFANVLYIYRDRFVRSVQFAAFFVFVVFTTISSGPLLSILIQAALTGWDRLLWFMRFKWVVFGFCVLMGFMLLRIASQFHVLDFIIQNLMFNPQTADGRLVILEYGSREIASHPLFGIGFNQWVRPWWKESSVDNFWLNHAMRFGLPSALFFFAAIAISAWRIVTARTLTPREASYRAGYLITLAGLAVVLGTVYIWSATAVFVCIYIGAGSWFYTRETETPTDRDRDRRAAQARAFSGVGPYPAPPAARPARGAEAREAAEGRTDPARGGREAGRVPSVRTSRPRRGSAAHAPSTGRPSGDSRHV